MSRVYQKRNSGDIVGKYNGELIEKVDNRLWKIKCKCGNIFVSQPSSTSGRCSKCGNKSSGLKNYKHGESPKINKNSTRLYNIWTGIHTRCYNKKHHSYLYYGARGITMCEEWGDYNTFKNWSIKNGYSDDLSLDRIDTNGNYEPNNCRWVTLKEQSRNKRNNKMLTYKGKTKPLVEWCEILNLPYHTIKNRINRYGYSVDLAFESPINHRNEDKDENI